ncbi:MAG: H-type small acid-soluble spore protein [Firmicutes bacterium]|nr:H-type small acid-soluble spore protein [Bacillota bacterium]
MDFERVRKIVKSEETIEVLHQGKPVWIESLDSSRNTASVSYGGETYMVPVQELVEGYPGFKVV